MRTFFVLLTSSVVAGDVWPNSLHLFPLPSLHLLGNVGASLQREFFTYERLSEEIAGSVFVSLDHVPDYRLRPIIHILPRALNVESVGFRCCAKWTASSLTSITGLCEEFGALLSSGVLRHCALPPAGPSFHLHAAGQDLCARPFYLEYFEFTHLTYILKHFFLCPALWFLQRLNVKWQVINQRTLARLALKLLECRCCFFVFFFSRSKDTFKCIVPMKHWGPAFPSTVIFERRWQIWAWFYSFTALCGK